MSKLQIKLINKNAIIPDRTYPQDIGLDLTAITIVKNLGKNTIMYDTGVAICPPEGYYTEIIARSSIVKTGYMLANGVGIIDPNYRGTLKICLVKIDESKPDLKLPFRLVQLILRKIESIDIIKVQELPDTNRGEGGFGSTD